MLFDLSRQRKTAIRLIGRGPGAALCTLYIYFFRNYSIDSKLDPNPLHTGRETLGGLWRRVDPELIEILRTQTDALGDEQARRFNPGDRVQPFPGLQAVYRMADGERRAMVLIEIPGKLRKLHFEYANLQSA